jgi:CMD domain protein
MRRIGLRKRGNEAPAEPQALRRDAAIGALVPEANMSEAPTFSSAGDVIDAIAGIGPGTPLDRLRRRRRDVFRHTQACHDVLFLPRDEGGISRAERAAIALRVALTAKDEPLATHYRVLLGEAGGADLIAAVVQPEAGDIRLAALLRHADLVALAPDEAGEADLRKLEALGLSSRDIVVLAELVAFVNFQTRLLAGLRILREERS